LIFNYLFVKCEMSLQRENNISIAMKDIVMPLRHEKAKKIKLKRPHTAI